MGTERLVMLHTAPPRDLKLSLLTPQERECLRLVGQQRSSKEIAHALGISKASVDTYCNRARAKLGVASRRDAAEIMRMLEAAVDVPVWTPAEPVAPHAAPAPQPLAAVTLFPPISSLGPLQRLGLIMAGAVVLALAFGMLVGGLQSLSNVLELAHRHAAEAPPAS